MKGPFAVKDWNDGYQIVDREGSCVAREIDRREQAEWITAAMNEQWLWQHDPPYQAWHKLWHEHMRIRNAIIDKAIEDAIQ